MACEFRAFLLPRRNCQAENGPVRWKTRFTGLAIAALSLLLVSAGQTAPRKPAPPVETRVDINHAGLDELLKVPGMTRSWAGRIIRFRPYRTKQDLLDGGVVSSEVYDRIKENIIAHRQPQ
jgi:DNA uptake protein ComE-like DNA-binding protein